MDDNWIIRRRNKKNRPSNKRRSEKVANYRNKYEALESDLDDYEEDEKKDSERDFSAKENT